MGAAMYGETAAGYGRPRLLAFGRPRTNYVQKIRPAAASANMCWIKCHTLVGSRSAVNSAVGCRTVVGGSSVIDGGRTVVGRTVVDGTSTVVGRTVIGRTVVITTIVGSIVVGIREAFHRERGNLFDGVVSCVENIPGTYVGIRFCC